MRGITLVVCLVAACGPSVGGNADAPPGTSDGDVVDGDNDNGPPYDDFPSQPMVEPGTPPGAPGAFVDPGSSTGGPCLVETEIGSLLPQRWLRPRFRFEPVGAQNLFELTLSVASQANPLRVYTMDTTWTMPAYMWTGLQEHSSDEPITVTVRAVEWNGTSGTTPATGSTGTIRIAPVAATGSIVYWTTTGTATLKGFEVGDESVKSILTPAQVGGGSQCIGCHTSTPDGKWLGFSTINTPTDGRPAWVGLRSADGNATAPPFISASAQTMFARQYQQEPVFSDAYWADGNRYALTMFETGGKTEIIWTNFEATSTAQNTGWGIVARNGDSGNAGGAVWSHDGTKVAYISAAVISSGINADNGGADIAIVPYAGGAGGTSTKLAGADSTTHSEAYPAFSEDDAFVAFTRVPNNVSSYDRATSEVFIVPTAGGTAVRLAANDPPACAGETSPGLTNSWPKWSPEVGSRGNTKYYWLTFSSKRGGVRPQLYVTPVVVDGSTVTTYPALYLWNQPASEANHTPAWDTFGIIL